MANRETCFLSDQIDLLDKILAASTDHIYVYDRTGRHLYASPAGLAALGLRAEEVLGKHWRELNFPADVMGHHDAQREAVFQTGVPVKGETSFPTISGIRHYEYVISPIFGKDGDVEAVLNTGRDITDRKQIEDELRLLAEELEPRVTARTQELLVFNQSLQLEIAERRKVEQVLQESELHFHVLVDAIFEGVIVQENGKIIDANLGFARKFGYSLAEVIGKSTADFLTPASLKVVLQHIESQYDLPYEVMGIKKDGTLLNLEVVCKPSLYQGRRVRVSAVRDITARKKAEAAVEEKQRQVQRQLAEIETIYQSAPIGLNVLDTELRFVRINQRLAEINGLSVEAHLGRTVREVLPDVADTAEQLLHLILETGEPLLNVELTGETPAQPGVQRTWLESFFPLKEGERIIGINTVCQEITERKRAEAERMQLLQQEQAARAEVERLLRQLEAERSRLEQVLRQMPVGVSIAEAPSGKLVYRNEEATRLLLHPLLEAETYQSSQFGAIHANGQPYQPQEYPLVRSLLSGEIIKAEEMHYCRGDGTMTLLSISAAPILDPDGQIIASVSTFEDISDRKRIEAELRDRERLFSTLAQALPVVVFRFDVDSNCIYINDYWMSLTGRTIESAMGMGWVETFHPEDRDRLVSAWLEWSQNAQQRGLYQNEGRLLHLDGTVIWYYIQALAEVDANGETSGYIGVMTNITDRKLAEQALREREALLRLFAQYAPAGIAMFDREMRYVMTSQRWADDYFLDSVASLIGRSHYDIFPELPERWKQIHQRCLAGAIEKCDEDLFVRADGTPQWLRWEVRPWYTATDEIGGIIIFSEDITQSKQAEASVLQLNWELQQKVTELQTLLEVIPIGIGIAEDPECRKIRVNPAFAHVLNIPPTVNASLSASEEERPTAFKVYQNGQEMATEELPLQYAAAHGVEVRDLEVEVVWQDGTVVTLLEYAAPLLDEQGQPRGSVGAFLNITGRKQAEAELQRYKDIFQFSEHGLATSKGPTLDLVNPAFARMHGYNPEEMINKPILDLFPPEYHPGMIAFMQQLEQAGHLIHESYHIRKDGTVFPILLDVTVVRDENSNFLYRIVTAFDITERKQAEVALLESQERYQTLVHNFPNGGVLLFDHDLRYVLVEGQGFAEIGLDRAYLEGKTIWEALEPDVCRVLEPYYREVLEGDSPIIEIPFADRVYRCYFLPLYDDQGQVKLGMVMTQDITLQKQVEQILTDARDELDQQVQARTQELQQVAEELQRSNQELEQFAYVASHDLQEPLRAITSFTQLLAKRYRGQLDAKADMYIEFIVDGAVRMQQLVRDLLSYSRVGRHELSMQAVDGNALLEQVQKNLQVAIAENQAILTAGPLPTITADPTQMVNLLQNLIGNSLKYRSEAIPQIHISAKLMSTQSNSATHQSNSPAEIMPVREWLFSIQDNGIGIEPCYADRIFGIFQRLHTSEEYSGTGLGLAICKKIVERHNGRIWVESQLGHGATFFFTIPISIRS